MRFTSIPKSEVANRRVYVVRCSKCNEAAGPERMTREEAEIDALEAGFTRNFNMNLCPKCLAQYTLNKNKEKAKALKEALHKEEYSESGNERQG